MSSDEKRRATTRILLANGQYVVREGFRRIVEHEPDLEVVGEANNGQQAVKLARELRPDIIVMEARLSKLDSIEVTRRIKMEQPEVAVLIFTACDDEEYIVGLIGAGADGYLLKSTESDLVQAIRVVQSGGFLADRMVIQKLYKRATRPAVAVSTAEHLTRRELEVLELAAMGMSNQEIGDELGIGLRTVKGHLETIFGKLGVRSRTEAVLMALKRGWVSLQGE
ncbi:Transcriptional regulatory protein DegU [subsurface metagenome]